MKFLIQMCLFLLFVLLTPELFANTQGGPDTVNADQGTTPIFSTCNVEVSQSLVSWAQHMLSISESVNCDSGSIPGGNCRIAGVPVDQSCSGNVSEISSALRNIRGDSGLGCLNRVNGNLASALLNALNNNNYKVCCDRCSDDSKGETSANLTCAVTYDNRDRRSGTISLNISSLTSTSPTSHCAGRYAGRGLEATLFHELLHTAGVMGFQGHSSGAFEHPLTEIPMDEKDVIADPIYGCQNLCYGRDSFSNSTSCMACSLAEPLPSDATQTATSSWGYLNTRLENTWALASLNNQSIPSRCQEMWNSSQGEMGRRIAVATLATREIKQKKDEIKNCLTNMRRRFRANKPMLPLLENCRLPFSEIQRKCREFAQTITMREGGRTQCSTQIYSVHSMSVMSMCRSAIRDVQNVLSTTLQFASDRQSINCSDWFGGEFSCPNISTPGYNTPADSSKCEASRAAP